eukprot:366553-Chlamydomonas_euryale.AAC.16
MSHTIRYARHACRLCMRACLPGAAHRSAVALPKVALRQTTSGHLRPPFTDITPRDICGSLHAQPSRPLLSPPSTSTPPSPLPVPSRQNAHLVLIIVVVERCRLGKAAQRRWKE